MFNETLGDSAIHQHLRTTGLNIGIIPNFIIVFKELRVFFFPTVILVILSDTEILIRNTIQNYYIAFVGNHSSLLLV